MKKNISIIVATTLNHVIGQNNQMPWSLPADLKWFKQQTLNKPVIMGRKTFESIGRLLPNRTNIILSKQEINYDGALVAKTIDAAITLAQDSDEIMIIGGANIYKQALPLTNKIYLTEIQTTLDGDAFFPVLDNTWNLVDETLYQADDKNKYDLKFKILEKK